MTATATLSSKFQISIPKSVREQQQWQAGQEFVFIPKGKGVLVMPVPELEQLAGIVKGADDAKAEKPAFKLRDGSVGGNGLMPEFQNAPWEKFRDAIYEDRG